MAPQNTTEAWDTAWTLTMRVERGRIADNIFDKTNTLNWARRRMMEMETGGKEIKEDLEYATTPAEWFAGHQELQTQEVDIATAAFYRWRYLAVPIIIAFDTEMEARKAVASTNVLKVKTSNAMKSIRDTVNAQFYSAQSGLSMLGFQDIIASDPTTGTLGGINRATNTWWRNKNFTDSTDFDAVSAGIYTGIAGMQTAWNAASDGNETPDVIFTTLTTYGQLQNIYNSTGYSRMEAKDRTKALFAGNPTYNGVPVLFDRDCGSGLLYMVNSDAVKLKVQSGINFSKTPFRSPYNQLSKVAFIVFSCQLITRNPRRTNVMTNIT